MMPQIAPHGSHSLADELAWGLYSRLVHIGRGANVPTAHGISTGVPPGHCQSGGRDTRRELPTLGCSEFDCAHKVYARARARGVRANARVTSACANACAYAQHASHKGSEWGTRERDTRERAKRPMSIPWFGAARPCLILPACAANDPRRASIRKICILNAGIKAERITMPADK
eukprot:6167397-Prymnesium_polylepis.1